MDVRSSARLFKLLRCVVTALALTFGLLAGQGCTQQGRPLTVNPLFDLRVVSDSAILPLAERLLASFENRHPDSLLTLSILNRSAALESLRNGEADAALIFHPLADREFFSTPIGYDTIMIITNENGAVTALSREQLRALFAGHLPAWGGQIIAREPGSSERMAFDALVMGSQATASTVQVALTPETMVTGVRASAGAIGYISGATGYSGVFTVSIDGTASSRESIMVGRYPLVTQVVFASAHDPRGTLRDLLDWLLSPEGQAIVGEHIIPLEF